MALFLSLMMIAFIFYSYKVSFPKKSIAMLSNNEMTAVLKGRTKKEINDNWRTQRIIEQKYRLQVTQ